MALRRVGQKKLDSAEGLSKMSLSLDHLTSIEEENDETLKLNLFAKNVEVGSQVLVDDITYGEVTLRKGEEIHFSLGVVLEPETLDLTRTEKSIGDIYNEDEIAKAAYDFNLRNWGKGHDLMHNGQDNAKLMIIESYLAPVEFMLGQHKVKKGTWLIKTLYFDPEVWEGVHTGKLTGLSIGGASNVRFEAAA